MPTEVSEFDREPSLPEDVLLLDDHYFDQLAEDHVEEERSEYQLLLPNDQPTHDTRPWYRRPSPWWIIPTIFIAFGNYGMLVAPLQMFFVTCVCEDYFAPHDTTPSQNVTALLAGSIPYEDCLIPDIVVLVSQLQIAYDLCGSIPALLTIGFWGKLSDRKGRKLILGSIGFGNLAGDAVLLIVAFNRHQIGYQWLIIAPLFMGLVGGMQLNIAASLAYISDCTLPGQRAVVFGQFFAVMFLGTAVGPGLGGMVMKATGDIVYLLYISLTIHALWLVYVTLIIPESLMDVHREAALGKRPQKFLDHINIFSAITILFTTKTEHVSKHSLPILGALNFFVHLALGSLPVMFLYAGIKFGWTAYENGLWMSLGSTMRIVAFLVILPILVHLFKKDDDVKLTESEIEPGPSSTTTTTTTVGKKSYQNDITFSVRILRTGYILDTFANIILGTASVGWMFFVGSGVHGLSTISKPCARSLMTRMVPPSQIGEVLAAVAIIDSVAWIIGPTVINLLYAATVSTIPSLLFYVLASLMLFAVVLTFFIKPIEGEGESEE